jgi:hypothetical protein
VVVTVAVYREAKAAAMAEMNSFDAAAAATERGRAEETGAAVARVWTKREYMALAKVTI